MPSCRHSARLIWHARPHDAKTEANRMRDFTDTDANWVVDYGESVCEHYRKLFAVIAAFPQASNLLERFDRAKDSVLSGG